MRNPIKDFQAWTVNDGSAHMASIKKWSDIALAVNPSYVRLLHNLVATVDAMYTANELSAGQKTEWDAEKVGLEAAVSAVCCFR